MVLDQVSRGNATGRNNNLLQAKTCHEKQYRVDYGRNFCDSFCENLGDSPELEKKVSKRVDDKVPRRSVDVQVDIPNLSCLQNKRKETQLYSFTKNIDYA